MSAPGRKTQWLVWGGLVLTIAAIGGAFVVSRLRDPGVKLVETDLPPIPNFNLTNQNNEPVSLASLRGQIWVADVIFTRCAGPCPRMTRHMAELQAALPASRPVRFITLTSDPDNDTPAVLKRYAAQYGADSNRWWFLTGNKREIHRLEAEDFKFVVVEKKPEEKEALDDLFIHSTFFMLIDGEGKLRRWTDREGRLHAYFNMDEPGGREQLLAAIAQLAPKQ